MKKVLVVVDCQNDFITGSLRNEEAIKALPNVVKKIREFNGDAILVTRDTHPAEYLKTKEGEKLPVEHCINSTWGWEIEDNVKSALVNAEMKSIPVAYISKPTFGSTVLADQIQNHFADDPAEIELIGFCTDICVISNALLIKSRVFNSCEVSIDSSCCAGVTPESHNAALLTAKMCQINVK